MGIAGDAFAGIRKPDPMAGKLAPSLEMAWADPEFDPRDFGAMPHKQMVRGFSDEIAWQR